MSVIRTDIEGVLIIEPKVFGDARGYFFESFNGERFAEETGVATTFVQDNESRSSYGVVRGLHFQKPPFAQGKLVRCVVGEVIDVAIDIREGSATYGKWVGVKLSESNHRQLWLPKGMAHGFAVLTQEAVFQYKCDEYYHPEAEGALAWDDPTIGIDWQVPSEKVVLSEKDSHHPRLEDFVTPFKKL